MRKPMDSRTRTAPEVFSFCEEHSMDWLFLDRRSSGVAVPTRHVWTADIIFEYYLVSSGVDTKKACWYHIVSMVKLYVCFVVCTYPLYVVVLLLQDRYNHWWTSPRHQTRHLSEPASCGTTNLHAQHIEKHIYSCVGSISTTSVNAKAYINSEECLGSIRLISICGMEVAVILDQVADRLLDLSKCAQLRQTG